MAETFDYIVVGAGSAGCVVAARLAEAGHTVNLIEAGGSDGHPWIQIPAGVAKLLYDPRHNWMYASEPEPGIDNRPIHTPRGKVLGGSGSINGMLYVRGNPADYDGWAQLGCRGWSFDDVLPLFRRSETYVQGGDTQYRGTSGPFQVEDYRTILPVTHMFVRAAQEAGFAFTPDLNGARQEGVELLADEPARPLARVDLPHVPGKVRGAAQRHGHAGCDRILTHHRGRRLHGRALHARRRRGGSAARAAK